jgi:hypothetical protein
MSSAYNSKIPRLEQYINRMSNQLILLSNELKSMNNELDNVNIKINSLEQKIELLSSNGNDKSVKKTSDLSVWKEVPENTHEFIIKNPDENKKERNIQLTQEKVNKTNKPKLNKDWLTNFN